ncbi:MAG: nuclear transport factor 2 family protein [Armatimonadetes bacterium]|nr:nuclear transport factor 2 family protein [Armatimonadota bacterium]
MDAKEKNSATAVREVMERYADATYRADVSSLRSLFHPAACMTGYLGDQLIAGGPDAFFADIEGRPPMAETKAPYEAEVGLIHVSGRIASAAVEESGFFGSGRFVNYFHLLNVDGDWRIVSKTFESL